MTNMLLDSRFFIKTFLEKKKETLSTKVMLKMFNSYEIQFVN